MEILLIGMRHKEPAVAGLLGLAPGAGHIYTGESMRGLTWLAGTLVGLVLFLVPGVLVWVVSIADATLCARRVNLGLRPLSWSPPARWISDGPDPECPESPSRDPVEETRPTAPAQESAR